MKPKMTKHMREDRVDRFVNIAVTIGLGEELDSFPRENEYGPTIHTITTTGVIIVKSARTSQVITCWIASPSQVYKLYGDKKPPISLIHKAKKNQQKGYLKMN